MAKYRLKLDDESAKRWTKTAKGKEAWKKFEGASGPGFALHEELSLTAHYVPGLTAKMKELIFQRPPLPSEVFTLERGALVWSYTTTGTEEWPYPLAVVPMVESPGFESGWTLIVPEGGAFYLSRVMGAIG